MPDIRLVYVSRRDPQVTDAEVIDGIVLPSMMKNRRLQITGCLWFDRDRFLQTLEGPAEAVDDVYAQIKADDRHEDVSMLLRQPQAHRLFARWAMKPVPALTADAIRDLVHDLQPHHAIPSSASERRDEAPSAMQRLVRLLAARAS